jgi:hypothetical protein
MFDNFQYLNYPLYMKKEGEIERERFYYGLSKIYYILANKLALLLVNKDFIMHTSYHRSIGLK